MHTNTHDSGRIGVCNSIIYSLQNHTHHISCSHWDQMYSFIFGLLLLFVQKDGLDITMSVCLSPTKWFSWISCHYRPLCPCTS